MDRILTTLGLLFDLAGVLAVSARWPGLERLLRASAWLDLREEWLSSPRFEVSEEGDWFVSGGNPFMRSGMGWLTVHVLVGAGVMLLLAGILELLGVSVFVGIAWIYSGRSWWAQLLLTVPCLVGLAFLGEVHLVAARVLRLWAAAIRYLRSTIAGPGWLPVAGEANPPVRPWLPGVGLITVGALLQATAVWW